MPRSRRAVELRSCRATPLPVLGLTERERDQLFRRRQAERAANVLEYVERLNQGQRLFEAGTYKQDQHFPQKARQSVSLL
jgi:hypothetical protein